MKTLEFSDEVANAIEGVRSALEPEAADFLLLFILSYLASNQPEALDSRWDDLKKQLPAKPIWEAFAKSMGAWTGPIRKLEGVMGGAACIGNSRIPVWVLVSLKKQGMNDGDLLRSYPTLQASDLEAAWSYYTVHSDEVDAVISTQADEDELG